MSSSDESGSSTSTGTSTGTGSVDRKIKKYRGVRSRKWGKWVSEIRVPGTRERLWLGSYAAPEAAAVAHDIASYCLRGPPSSLDKLNFPRLRLPAGVGPGMSPPSIQKVASDAGMAVDAQFAMKQQQQQQQQHQHQESSTQEFMSHVDTTEVNQNVTRATENWQSADGGDRYFGNNWESNQSRSQGEDLNISVEDYL